MNNLIKKNLVFAAALLLAGAAQAQDFSLNGLGLSGLTLSAPEVTKATPVRPQTGGDEDVQIGLDMTIRIPFGAVKKAVQNVAAKDPRISLIDAAAPILVRSGEFLKVVNLKVDVGGIKVTPVLTIKPYFEGKDKLAIKLQKVQLHVSASPDVKAAGEPLFDKDQMMADVMATVMQGINTALDAKLKESGMKMKAADVLKMSYDKDAWITHAEISMAFVSQYLPADLVGDIHLNGFSFNDTKIFIQFGTDF